MGNGGEQGLLYEYCLTQQCHCVSGCRPFFFEHVNNFTLRFFRLDSFSTAVYPDDPALDRSRA